MSYKKPEKISSFNILYHQDFPIPLIFQYNTLFLHKTKRKYTL